MKRPLQWIAPALVTLAGIVAPFAGAGTLHDRALPLWTFALGSALLAGGLTLSARAMCVNPFFEGTVRIQLDRGQRVVDAGPYRFIRHPGYAGLGLLTASFPLLFGSAWSLAVALAILCWLAVRTILEDRLLHDELPGYREYASRVRHRLVPGVW